MYIYIYIYIYIYTYIYIYKHIYIYIFEFCYWLRQFTPFCSIEIIISKSSMDGSNSERLKIS